MSLNSCVRDYTCKCTMTYTGQVGLPESQVREYPIKNTKKEAANKCQTNSKVYQDGPITTYEECALW